MLVFFVLFILERLWQPTMKCRLKRDVMSVYMWVNSDNPARTLVETWCKRNQERKLDKENDEDSLIKLQVLKMIRRSTKLKPLATFDFVWTNQRLIPFGHGDGFDNCFFFFFGSGLLVTIFGTCWFCRPVWPVFI